MKALSMFSLLVALIAGSIPLHAEIKVLALSGSTRKDSYNKKLVSEAAEVAKQLGAQVTVIDLKDYSSPFYDEDMETGEGMPQKAKELRRLLIQNQVILIASPEYNGSLSAILKNAIDWASRSETGGPSREAFKGKKFVLMSTSPGPSGGINGLKELRKILENVGGTVVAQQLVIPDASHAFNQQGLKSSQSKAELKNMIQAALNP